MPASGGGTLQDGGVRSVRLPRTARSRGLVRAQWLLLVAWSVRNTLFMRQRASTTFATVDAAAGVQIGLVGLSGILLVASGKLGELFGNARSPLQWLLYYYLLCAISAVWSPMPAYSFYRGMEALILVAGTATAMMRARDQRCAERTLLLLALLTVLLSIGQNVRLHGLGAMASLHAWHTNTYTAVAALCLAYAFGEYRAAVDDRRQWMRWTMLLGGAAVVVGTSSASNVSALAGLLVAATLQRRFALIAVLVVVSLVAAAVLISNEGGALAALGWLFPGKSEYGIETLGGRTVLWELYWENLRARPILGNGFGVLAFGNGQSVRLSSHNSYIASVLGAGLLGGLLAALFLCRLGWQALQGLKDSRPGAIGGAAALATALVNSNSMPLFLELWEESNLVSTALIAYLVYFVWQRGPARRSRARPAWVGP